MVVYFVRMKFYLMFPGVHQHISVRGKIIDRTHAKGAAFCKKNCRKFKVLAFGPASGFNQNLLS